MDKSSEAYRRAQTPDQQGLVTRLQVESEDYLKQAEEQEKQEMGTTASSVIQQTRRVMDWAVGDNSGDDEDEFEYNDTHEQSSDKITPIVQFPEKEDPEIVLDPLIVCEMDQVRDAVGKMKDIFSPRKAPTFSFPISKAERSRFREFLNLINQTSDSHYVLSTGNSDIVTVTKLPEVNYTPTPVSVSVATDQITESRRSPSESTISEATNKTFSSPALVLSSRNLTANHQSLFSQFTRGVLLPPRMSSGKHKRITISNLGIPEAEIMGLLVDNPAIRMEELIRKAFKKKGNWKLINNMYDVKKYKLY